MSSESNHYDSIVIGSGQAGGPLSTALVGAKQRVALIEREHVGGTCINEGCTPTKTMVASARVAYLTRRSADYGVHYDGQVTVDLAKVRQRKRDIVDSFRGGSERRIKEGGVDLLAGEASFVGPHEIEVRLNSGETRRLTADRFFINTGERPATPKIEGIAGVKYLNSTTIMELDKVPEHLLILGGGYIGLEFGQMFRRFGSRVTVVQRGEQLLGREDKDIAEEVAKILQEDGIEVLLKTAAVQVEQSGPETIRLTVKTAEGERTLEGSHLLAAAGRVPNTDKLNPAAAGIELDERGYIKVNDTLQTSVPHIYALGDVKGGPAFTHISYDDFRIIRTNLIEGGQASIKDRQLVYTVFMDPQLGRVGLNETEARQQGRNIKVAKMPMSYVARALEMDEPRGLMKAIIDADNGQILGGMILGIEGGEMMSVLQMAIMGKLPYTTLRDAVFAHPTLAEAFNNLFTGV